MQEGSSRTDQAVRGTGSPSLPVIAQTVLPVGRVGSHQEQAAQCVQQDTVSLDPGHSTHATTTTAQLLRPIDQHPHEPRRHELDKTGRPWNFFLPEQVVERPPPFSHDSLASGDRVSINEMTRGYSLPDDQNQRHQQQPRRALGQCELAPSGPNIDSLPGVSFVPLKAHGRNWDDEGPYELPDGAEHLPRINMTGGARSCPQEVCGLPAPAGWPQCSRQMGGPIQPDFPAMVDGSSQGRINGAGAYFRFSLYNLYLNGAHEEGSVCIS